MDLTFDPCHGRPPTLGFQAWPYGGRSGMSAVWGNGALFSIAQDQGIFLGGLFLLGFISSLERICGCGSTMFRWGHHLGFKVTKLFERSFRFFVAGNKVGHYIHGLKYRIWPDIVCDFHLFNGRFNGYNHFDSQWHANERLDLVANRSPMAIRIDKSVFTKPTGADPAASSELWKFGLIPIASMDFNNSHSHEASCSKMPPSIRVHPAGSPVSPASLPTTIECPRDFQENLLSIGNLQFPCNVTYPKLPQCFLSSAFKYSPPHSSWPPLLSKAHITDLSRACYIEKEIKDIVDCWAALCSRCIQWGHTKSNCHARIICISCSAPGHKGINFPVRPRKSIDGNSIMGPDYTLAVKSTHPVQEINFPTRSQPCPLTAPMSQPSSTVRCESCGHHGPWSISAGSTAGPCVGSGDQKPPLPRLTPRIPLHCHPRLPRFPMLQSALL